MSMRSLTHSSMDDSSRSMIDHSIINHRCLSVRIAAATSSLTTRKCLAELSARHIGKCAAGCRETRSPPIRRRGQRAAPRITQAEDFQYRSEHVFSDGV